MDPLATGVLVIGVGKGTKQLSRFIECTKSYDVTMLFGTATDSYDVLGRILAHAPYEHVSKTGVEHALQAFRGQVMQKPPIYSAIRMQGKRLYEYARAGLELPAEIAARPVVVEDMRVVEWLKAGSHNFEGPAQEAEDFEKRLAQHIMHVDDANERPGELSEHESLARDSHSTLGGETDTDGVEDQHSSPRVPETDEKEALQERSDQMRDQEDASKLQAALSQHCLPAARLQMTVTSGFYVRSLCHDLGKAVGSLGVMASLVRTRQGTFELGRNVLNYDDLDKGEDTWGPKVATALQEWNESHDDTPQVP